MTIMLLNRRNTKQFTLESILPIILLPLLVYLSTLSFLLTLAIIFFFLPALLCHVYLIFRFNLSKKNFFYVWSVTSIFFIFVCFEFFVVPLMVISPKENILFFALFCCILISARKIQEIALNSKKIQNTNLFVTDQVKADQSCCIKISDIVLSCGSCQTSVFQKNCYNAWINCTVVEMNRKSYYVLLSCTFLWLGYTSYLILTTICQSYLIFNSILIPCDCRDVYTTARSAVCFVGVLYSLEIIVFIIVVSTREVFSIFK